MEWRDLVVRVGALAGIEPEDAACAIRASLLSLVEGLDTDEAEALGRELPSLLRPLLRGHAMAMPLDKLSRASGVVQERKGRTLATWRP